MTLKSSNILTLDPSTALPTGTLTPSPDGSAHDHRTGKAIGERYPNKGYDDFYLFDTLGDVDSLPVKFDDNLLKEGSLTDFLSPFIFTRPPAELQPVAFLSSEKSGVKLQFTTNQAGVQLYTAPGGGGNTKKKLAHKTSEDTNEEYGSECTSSPFPCKSRRSRR